MRKLLEGKDLDAYWADEEKLYIREANRMHLVPGHIYAYQPRFSTARRYITCLCLYKGIVLPNPSKYVKGGPYFNVVEWSNPLRRRWGLWDLSLRLREMKAAYSNYNWRDASKEEVLLFNKACAKYLLRGKRVYKGAPV